MTSETSAPRRFALMGTVVYLNGAFLESPERARVSLFDRGFLYGDSVFETLRCYGKVPFRLDQHLERLAHGADVLGISLPEQRRQLADVVHEAVMRSGLCDSTIRITLSRGIGPGRLSPDGCDTPTLAIVVTPPRPYPPDAYQNGISSMVVNTRRVPAECLPSSIKCGNYLPSIQARRELDRAGLLEGVQLSVHGHVVCGTVSNVFLVQGDRLQTPDLASGCLPGITRAAVLEVAPRAGLVPLEERLRPERLSAADEMFFTNSLMECLPVAEIDGHRFSAAPGPKTKAAHEAFRALVQEETQPAGAVKRT